MPPSSHIALPPLTSPSPPPHSSSTSNPTSRRRPKRSALEPPAFTHNRSTSPRQHATSPRQRNSNRVVASRTFQNHPHINNQRREATRQEDLAALVGWPPDALNHVFTSSPQADNDVTFLNDLVDHDFSSPSDYPSFNTNEDLPRLPRSSISRTASGTSTSTSTSTTSRILHDLNIMPPTRRRRESTTAEQPASKRRRTATPRKVDHDDPFRSSSPASKDGFIDLTADDGKAEFEKLFEEKEQEKEDNGDIVKLSAFQCVICMDDATNLTVTHCGHLYCADCLHSSLHVETTRGRCPMCRSKLETKPRAEYTSRTKGYYPLELKVMTRTKKGKKKMKVVS